MTISIPLQPGRFVAVCLALLLSACAPSVTMQPFASDGCSMFPDRALIGATDWCRCCLAHDLAYWRGGTVEARLQADQALKSCVQQASGSEALADLMFAGVRAGGGPYFYTPYRWGYGWAFGRPYGPLTPAEEQQASSLEREYRDRNPTLACPGTAVACR
jgi:hypothetical protein